MRKNCHMPFDALSVTALPTSRAEARERGERTFVTGKPCRNGHLSRRYTSTGQCAACITGWKANNPDRVAAANARTPTKAKTPEQKARSAERAREKRAADPEAVRIAERARRAAAPEIFRERDRARYAANPEIFNARGAIYHSENKERDNARANAYYAANREELRAAEAARNAANPLPNRLRVKAWRQENPEAKNAQHRLRRARKANAEGSHTAEEIQNMMVKQRFKCAGPACQTSLKPGFHADHIMPLAKGGSNWIRNIQLLCPDCNCRKNALHPLDWARREGCLV